MDKDDDDKYSTEEMLAMADRILAGDDIPFSDLGSFVILCPRLPPRDLTEPQDKKLRMGVCKALFRILRTDDVDVIHLCAMQTRALYALAEMQARAYHATEMWADRAKVEGSTLVLTHPYRPGSVVAVHGIDMITVKFTDTHDTGIFGAFHTTEDDETAIGTIFDTHTIPMALTADGKHPTLEGMEVLSITAIPPTIKVQFGLTSSRNDDAIGQFVEDVCLTDKVKDMIKGWKENPPDDEEFYLAFCEYVGNVHRVNAVRVHTFPSLLHCFWWFVHLPHDSFSLSPPPSFVGVCSCQWCDGASYPSRQ